MLVYLDLVYRSYTLQNGGRFKNAHGRDIVYDSKYLILGDFIENDKAFPVILKTKAEDKNRFEKILDSLKPYDKVSCECQLTLYNKNVTLTLINAKKV